MYNMQQIYEANRLLPTLLDTYRTISQRLLYATDTPLFNNDKVRESNFFPKYGGEYRNFYIMKLEIGLCSSNCFKMFIVLVLF
jgi:hypothetical protein